MDRALLQTARHHQRVNHSIPHLERMVCRWVWSFLRLFWALFRHVSKEASNGHGRFGGSVCRGSLLTCSKQQGSSLTRLQQQDSALTPLASIPAYFQGSFKFTWLLWGQPLPRFPFDTLLAASFFLGTFAAVF